MAKGSQDCVLLLGDSLTELQEVPGSFHEHLSKAYSRKLDILNRGLGGYTAQWSLPMLDYCLARKGEDGSVVRLVTLWYGTNDSCLPPKEQANPPSTYKENLNTFLEALTSPESPYAVADTPISIVLITPPPVHVPMVPITSRHLRTLEHSKKYVDVVKEVAQEWQEKGSSAANKTGWKVGLIDLWEGVEKAAGGLGEGLEPYFTDGVHLSTKGYAVLWDLFRNLIRTDFANRGLNWEDPDDLPRPIPYWADIDLSRPESLLERLSLPKIRREAPF